MWTPVKAFSKYTGSLNDLVEGATKLEKKTNGC